MAPKVFDFVDLLMTTLEWLGKNTRMGKWTQGKRTFSSLIWEVRFVRGVCYCAEKFLLQDLPSESEENEVDQTLESFFSDIGDAIGKKTSEINSAFQEINFDTDFDDTRCDALFSIFLEVEETLQPLFGKALDKYMHSSQSKHCTVDELVDFIQLVLEVGREIQWRRSPFNSLQLHKLDFLKNFISFAASQSVGEDKLQGLLAHTQVVVITAAFCFYMLWRPQIVAGATSSLIYSQYSEMLEVQPVIIREASRSLCSSDYTRLHDDVLGDFVKFLLDIDSAIFSSKDKSTTAADPQILIKELGLLRNFLKDEMPKGLDLGEEIANLICEVVSEAAILFYSLSLDDLKEDTELGLTNWLEKVKFLKLDATKKYLKIKFPRNNEFGYVLMASKQSDSTRKLSYLIDTMRSYMAWPTDFVRGTNKQGEFDSIKIELIFAQRICNCLEMFSLQDLTSESDDKSSESFLDCLVAINEKTWEIHSFIHEMRKKNKIREGFLTSFPSFHHVVEILRSFLFGKALVNYVHSAQSKHYTTEELLDFIQLISEEAKKIHRQSSCKCLQLHKLDFLKNLISFAASRGIEQDKLQDLLAHTKVVVTTAAYYSHMLWEPKASDSTRKSLIYSRYFEMLKIQESVVRVLRALGSSCSSDNTKMDDNIVGAFIDSLLLCHWELLSSKSSFTVSSMKILIEELRFLRIFLIYKRQEGGDLDEEMTNLIFYVVSEAGIVSGSVSLDDEKEVPCRDTEIGLLNWMEKVQLLKEDVAKKYPATSRYKFPRTNELGFMDGLLEDLKELIRCKPDSIAFAQGKLDVVLEDLVFLRDFLRHMVQQRNENEKLKALWMRVVDVAYKSEFVINSLVVRDPSPDCSPTSFNTIKEEIKKIRVEVEEISVEKWSQIGASNTPKNSNRLPSRINNPIMDEVVVGFEDAAEEIISQLEANSAELYIVPIVGMGGQGKTTLARKVYNDMRTKSHFHVCAWCCVSQGYQKRTLLLHILSYSLDELPAGVDKKCDEDLENDLRQSLMGRRYLIILDDIWDIEVWRGLKPSFPDDRNGSRILITSRIHIEELQAKPYFLGQLNDDESRELLVKKLFHNKGCPTELQDMVMQIARRCKGIPFAVVTIAGILATLEQDGWEDLANGLSTALVSGTELLELSYTHLPDYLKPCLLYFGSFLQDEEIPVSRLIWSWMAEGFVQETTAAEDNLKDLIKRSLVTVVKKASRGGIKTCSVHDLVHQFCVTRAKEENFLQLLNLQKKIGPLSEPRRLCIYSSDGVPCFRHLSSLKLFPNGDYSEVLSILCNFKILKVLDLRGINCSLFPAEVEMLVHLKFLALVGNLTSIPSTVVELWNLETFLLRGLRGEISLPYTLLKMTKLRHMRVNPRVVFSLPEQNLEKCCESCNLETFSTLLLSSGQDMEEIIRKMPNLRKLKCTFVGSQGVNNQFPALNFLSQLESLKVHSTGKVRYQLVFSFPKNLKKLTLSNCFLPWTSISRFAELPNLEVLKLVNRACEGETWDMEAEVFTKLQFLKFENLDIVHWNACSDNFPCLLQLVLHKCRKLQGIPSCIGEVASLKIVEVKRCHISVETSAQILEEEVEGLKAFIYASPKEM